MTQTLFPTVRHSATLANGIVTCKQGTKTIESAVVAGEDVRGLFGGGDEATVNLDLWREYLSPKAKKAIRFAVKLHNYGDLAELKARWNETNLNRIINKIIDDELNTQHESRTTRKGLRYGTFGNERSEKPGFAGIVETERRT